MALTIRLPLQGFLEKIEKYKALRTDVSGIKDKMKRKMREAQWAVSMKGEVEKFRAVIVAKTMAINLLLQLNVMSTASKVDARTKAIESACDVHREVLSRSVDELRKSNTAQIAMAESVSNLLRICAGLDIGVQNARTILRAQHLDVSSQLQDLQKGQQLSQVILAQSGRILFKSLDKLDILVLKLSEAFGSFSVTALRLLKSILKTNLEIYALLCKIQDRMPKEIAFSTEDCINFTDALGRTQRLVYQWFKHWDVFESLLRCNFKNLPGEALIHNGQFLILNARRKGLIIERQRWDQSIFPGSKVGMSMLITDEVFPEGICPGCGQSNSTSSDEPRIIVCSSCQLEYHDLNDTNHKPTGNTQRHCTVEIFKAFLDSSQVVTETLDALNSKPGHPIDNELEYFKTIHVRTGQSLKTKLVSESTTGDTFTVPEVGFGWIDITRTDACLNRESTWVEVFFVCTEEEGNFISESVILRYRRHLRKRVRDKKVTLCFSSKSTLHQVYSLTFRVKRDANFDVKLGKGWEDGLVHKERRARRKHGGKYENG
ncbi:uncharacterized protein PAC_12411 [Phialocephala subalpina]|uniref:Ubiquitin-like domain-containing protein n=1 Tax=Phialocephala subalpina TaxID=576137 RepID=A0A1L7XBV4_9HELO|nr:uncharacterized protein PAC_12411 [Phialocephala subalpina]